MTDIELAAIIRQALAARRGYADSRSWPLDRGQEEFGVAQDFVEAAHAEPGAPYRELSLRPAGADPPDCEAIDSAGNRVAIEITELVHQKSVERIAMQRKQNRSTEGVAAFEWNKQGLVSALQQRLEAKDYRNRLKDGPYDSYIVVIYTAEHGLTEAAVRPWLITHRFIAPRSIDRAYFSLDYEPGVGYPLIGLTW
jgi:hypothetical protein